MDLVRDILNEAKQGANKTRLVYATNLNFKLLEKYLTFLIAKGLVAKSEDGGPTYQTTKQGEEFLKHYASLETILKAEPQTIAR